MSGHHRPAALIDRIVRDRVSLDDRAHAAACTTCGPLLARAVAFDDELRRSAGALVREHLPSGILDTTLTGRPPLRVTTRRPAPGFVTILATAALLVATTLVALGPGSGPDPTMSPSPSRTERPTATKAPFVERFRATDVIRGQLAKLGYSCNDGGTLPSPGTAPDAVARDAAVCVAPESIGPIIVVAIVGESAAGQVVQVAVKGDLVGGDTPENRGTFADAVAKLFAIALLDEGAGQSGGAWARVHVPELEVGDRVDVVLRSIAFHAEHGSKGYYVTARGARSG